MPAFTSARFASVYLRKERKKERLDQYYRMTSKTTHPPTTHIITHHTFYLFSSTSFAGLEIHGIKWLFEMLIGYIDVLRWVGINGINPPVVINRFNNAIHVQEPILALFVVEITPHSKHDVLSAGVVRLWWGVVGGISTPQDIICHTSSSKPSKTQ